MNSRPGDEKATGIVAFRTTRKSIGGDGRTWLEMAGDRWIEVTMLDSGCSGWERVVVGNERLVIGYGWVRGNASPFGSRRGPKESDHDVS